MNAPKHSMTSSCSRDDERTHLLSKDSSDVTPNYDDNQQVTLRSTECSSCDVDHLTIRSVDSSRASRCRTRCPITIEPVTVMYFISLVGTVLIDTQMFYAYYAKQAGIPDRTQGQSQDSCTANTTAQLGDAAIEVQKKTSNLQMYCQTAQYLTAIPTAVLLGAYSDKAGRKIPLLLPLAGYALRQFLYILVIYFETNILYVILANFLEGLTGGMCAYLMASFAYITDVTTVSQKAFRLMVLEIAMGISVVISSLGAGVLIASLGFYETYLICFLTSIMCFFYVLIIIPETITTQHKVKFFNVESFQIIYRVITDDSVTSRKWQLNLNLLLFFMFYFVDTGTINVQMIRMLAYPVCLGAIGMGVYVSESYMLKNIMSMIVLKLFHKRVGAPGLILIGIISGIGISIGFTLVNSASFMFIVPFFGMCSSLATSMLRTICSNLVIPSRQGSLFALIATEQLVASLISGVVWNGIYQATVSISPAIVFLVAALFLTCVPLPMAIYQCIRMPMLSDLHSQSSQITASQSINP